MEYDVRATWNMCVYGAHEENEDNGQRQWYVKRYGTRKDSKGATTAVVQILIAEDFGKCAH